MQRIVLLLSVCFLLTSYTVAQNVGYMGKKLLLGTHIELAPYATQLLASGARIPCNYKGEEPANKLLFFYMNKGLDLEYTLKRGAVLAADFTISKYGVLSRKEVQRESYYYQNVNYINASVNSFSIKYIHFDDGFIAPIGMYNSYGLSLNQGKVDVKGASADFSDFEFSTISFNCSMGYRKVFLDQVLLDLAVSAAYPLNYDSSMNKFDALTIYMLNRLLNARIGLYYML